jgi:hypothetical protein
MVRAVLPTPPSPSTTSLYSVIFPAIVPVVEQRCVRCRCRGRDTDKGPSARRASREPRRLEVVSCRGFAADQRPQLTLPAAESSRGAGRRGRRGQNGRR